MADQTSRRDTEPGRRIFRADAVRRYLQRREQTVLPRFVSPRSFVYLWISVGLLVAGGFATWFIRVPVYASGPAVVVDWNNATTQGTTAQNSLPDTGGELEGDVVLIACIGQPQSHRQ